MAQLSDAQVVELRERYAAGATQKELAAEFGIAQTAVSAIVRGKTRAAAGGPIAAPSPTRTRTTGEAGTKRTGAPSSGKKAPGGKADPRGTSGQRGKPAPRTKPTPTRPPLTTDDVAAIQRQVREGQARVDVAESWGISRWTVDSIMSGRFTGRDASEARRESERIRQIRTLAAAGTTQQEIAERFGLTQQAVSQIVRGVTHPETGGPISTG